MNDLSTNNQSSHQADSKPSIAIVYHSNYGHTRRVAQAIAQGANGQVGVSMVDIAAIDEQDWACIDAASLIVFGSAVYMGSVTAEFKTFMDSTSKRWVARTWQGKFAAGFANSGGLSGDKLAVLQQLCLFAMQHGMNWVGMPLMPTGNSEEDLNRLSSFLGLMTQSADLPPELSPCQGDIQTAVWFGEHLAKTLLRFTPNSQTNQTV
ncbi:flavodoxin family protein [Moraxella cuniculi]|uniref:Trp repressor-binding protein n=1 Tax=Moraxella cuniculi TaxID=34061 RepID=A0A448GXI6_9GAMM|nr:flavodoxin family protein [Moraxella cuniculi]VEG13475.1 Trp repressor-binding protein [Moraxella cuniculi]